MNMMIPPPSLMPNQFHQQQIALSNMPPIMNPKSFPIMQNPMQNQMQNQNQSNNNNSNNNFNNNGSNNNNNNNNNIINNSNNNNNKFNQINNQQIAKNPPALMSLMSLNPFGIFISFLKLFTLLISIYINKLLFKGSNTNQNQQIPISPHVAPLMSIPPPAIIHPGKYLTSNIQ